MKRVSNFSLMLVFFCISDNNELDIDKGRRASISVRPNCICYFQVHAVLCLDSEVHNLCSYTAVVKLTCRHCIEGKEGLCNMCLYCTRKTIVKRVFNLFLSSPLWASLSGQVAQAQIHLYLVTHYTPERHITVPVTKSG